MKTINAVFPNLDFFRAEGNIVTVAYPGPAREAEDLATVARDRDKAFGLRYTLQDLLAQRRQVIVLQEANHHLDVVCRQLLGAERRHLVGLFIVAVEIRSGGLAARPANDAVHAARASSSLPRLSASAASPADAPPSPPVKKYSGISGVQTGSLSTGWP